MKSNVIHLNKIILGNFENILYFNIIFFLFSFLYIKIVVPVFSYEGYYIDISVEKIALSIFFLFFISLLIKKKEMVSTALINALISFSYIPMLVLFSFENLSLEYMIYVTISLYVVILFSQYLLNYIRFKIVPFNINFILLFLIPLIFIVLAFMFYKNIAYCNLDINKVYEYRRIINKNTPVLIAYAYNILFKGIIPLLFLFYLFQKYKKFFKIVISVSLIILYTFLFAITSQKFYLFIIPFIVTIYLCSFFLRQIKLIFLKIVIFLIIFIIILSMLKGELQLLISSMFVRRLFFVPASLNFAYFDFFKDHQFVYFTDSKFLPFYYIFGYPYDLSVSHLIGREIFMKPDMAANTGWLGSGYAQMGFLGMILYAFIISLILRYLDYLSKYLNKKFLILSFIPYIITLFLSSDLKTTLLNHGLFFYIILLSILAYYQKRRYYFYAKDKDLSYNKYPYIV